MATTSSNILGDKSETATLLPTQEPKCKKPLSSKWAILHNAIRKEAHRVRNEQGHNPRNSMISIGKIKGASKPIKKWYRAIVIRQRCHSHLASEYLAKDMALNTITVSLTALTSASIFLSIPPQSASDDLGAEVVHVEDRFLNASSFGKSLTMLAGIVSAINTVLQGVTRTLKWGECYEKHMKAYKDFSKLRFQLENIMGTRPLYGEHCVNLEALEVWIDNYEEVLESSPIVPQKTFDHVADDEDQKGLAHTKQKRDLDEIRKEEEEAEASRMSRIMNHNILNRRPF